MKYLKNILIHIELFVLFPVFPLLLSLMIFIACRVFDPVILCDDNGLILYQLKTDLSNQITKFSKAIFSKELHYTMYQGLMHTLEPNSINASTKQSLLNNINRSCSEMNESLEKIHELERFIKRIDPSYKPLYLRSVRFGVF